MRATSPPVLAPPTVCEPAMEALDGTVALGAAHRDQAVADAQPRQTQSVNRLGSAARSGSSAPRKAGWRSVWITRGISPQLGEVVGQSRPALRSICSAEGRQSRQRPSRCPAMMLR